jgi:hypothetical protein
MPHCSVTVKNTFIEVADDVPDAGHDCGVLSPSTMKRQGSEPVLSSMAMHEIFSDCSSTRVNTENEISTLAVGHHHTTPQHTWSEEPEQDTKDEDLEREDTDELWPTWKEHDLECPAQNYYCSEDSSVTWASMWGFQASNENGIKDTYTFDHESFECDALDAAQPSLELAMRAINACDPDCHPHVREALTSQAAQVRRMRRRKRKSSIDIAFAAAVKAEAFAAVKPQDAKQQPQQPPQQVFNGEDIPERQTSSSSSNSVISRNQNVCHNCKGVWKEHFKFCGFCGTCLSTAGK